MSDQGAPPNPPQKPTGPPPGIAQLPRLAEWVPYVVLDEVFTPEECQRIVALREEVREARIEDTGGDADYRKSRIAWLKPGPEHAWVFQRCANAIGQANQRFYRLELAGFTEPLQIGEYAPGQYYHWHLDFGAGRYSLRKLSFAVQLSDPESYQGGDFEIMTAKEPARLPRRRGAMLIFQPFILHRVAEVTAGIRHSLVGWIGGPHYK